MAFFETRIENLDRLNSNEEFTKNQTSKYNKGKKYSNKKVSEENSSDGTENNKNICQY